VGSVPFVEFQTTLERFADLKYYKEQIDVYDIIAQRSRQRPDKTSRS